MFQIKERPMGATSGIPLINEVLIPHHSGIYAQRRFEVKLLVEWIQKTPEALGIIKGIAQDIVTKISFRKFEKKKMGRPKKGTDLVEKAENFASQNRLKEMQIATVMDWIMTGDFFVWMGTISDKQMSETAKELGEEIYGRHGIEFKETETKVRKFLDEDYTDVRAIRYAPSETVEIDYTEEEVKGYVQTTYSTYPANNTASPTYLPTGIQRRYWEPKQIIHGKFMDMSGKVYGFTPMTASRPLIQTLGLIKDYAGTFFQNGGVPDWLFMFESQGFSNSQNIQEFKEDLQKYKSSAMKHGNLVAESSGKIHTVQLSKFDKDMEFRQLMVMYAGLLAFSVGFPSVRLKVIIGADVKGSTGETDAETDAYQRNLENMQDYILDLWNTQLWIPHFGVVQEFSRGYRQDEVREVQRDVQKVAYVKSLSDAGIVLEDDYVKKYLNLDDKNVKKIDLEPKDEFAMGGMLPNNKVIKGPASQAHQEEKKKQAPKDKNKQMGS